MLFPDSLSQNSKLRLTAAASRGVPSVKVTPSWSVKVQVSPSSEDCHPVASQGTISPPSVCDTSESRTWRERYACWTQPP